MLWQAALCTVYQVYIPQVCYIVLGMTVWLIYMVDHTLDVLGKVDPAALTARHAFYYRNRVLFAGVVIPTTAILVALLALTALPYPIMGRGLALAFVVGIYLLHYAARKTRWLYILGNMAVAFAGGAALWLLPFSLSYRLLYGGVLLGLLALSFSRKNPEGFRLLPKELVSGYLFAVGSSLCVNFYTEGQQAGPMALETLVFGLICTLNCVAIACYERENDAGNDPNAITQTWPGIARMYPALLVSLGAVTIYALSQHMSALVLYSGLGVLSFSIALLGLLHHQAKRLNPELSHVLADAALAVPMLVVVMLG